MRLTVGMASSRVQNFADTPTLRTSVSNRAVARSSNRSKAYSSRPNALTTRSPSACSSTWVATLPDWSCAARESLVN